MYLRKGHLRMRLKIIPIVNFFVILFYQLIIIVLDKKCILDMYSLIFILFAGLVVLVPIISFLYSKLLLKENKNKILFVVYNSLLITLSYIVLYVLEEETYLYSVVLFSWSFLWGLLGLIRKKRKNGAQNRYNK